MSALAVLKEAAECGVRVSVNGDRVALKGAVKPPADLLAKLQKHKAAIVALLRAEGKPEHAASAPGTPATPGTTATLPAYQAALAKFKEHRPHGFTRFRHDQAAWAAEMFLNEWGELACEFDWPVDDIFGPRGLAWWLGVEVVRALGPETAVTETNRVYDRVTHTDWLNSYKVQGNG